MLVLAMLLSYLLGAIPVGYLLTKALKGVDIRRFGSGNVGATNVFRVVHPLAAVAVLILDIIKGIIPVTLFADWVLQLGSNFDPVLLRLILAVFAVSGHNWTIFLKFQGGKGIATSTGALLGLSLKIPALGLILGLCMGVWLLVLLTTGFVSLSSIIAACALPLLMIVFSQPLKLTIFAAALCLFAVYRHKSNIGKLLRGEEKKIFSAKNQS
ncbi:MAG: glycerol-3-phosphate 1-O-acyltransferase PlsY [Candidatus Omnitrophica bacterium]|nr:glycerol-3-phosphate 1-O-acyltransferase PlsY [Candidatus Omnitrophota bacterium]